MINNQLQKFAELKSLSNLKSFLVKFSVGKFKYEYSFVLVVMLFSLALSSSIVTYSFITNRQTTNVYTSENIQVLGVNDVYLKEEIYWENLLVKHPDYFPGWIRLTEIKNVLGKTSEATTALKKAEEIDPNSPLLKESN